MAEAVVSCSGRRAAPRAKRFGIRKGGLMETAREFLERRAGHAKPKDLLKYLAQGGAGVAGRIGPLMAVG